MEVKKKKRTRRKREREKKKKQPLRRQKQRGNEIAANSSPATDSVISREPIYSCPLAAEVRQRAGGKKLRIRLMRREEIRWSRFGSGGVVEKQQHRGGNEKKKKKWS